jgi:hypothetical protein
MPRQQFPEAVDRFEVARLGIPDDYPDLLDNTSSQRDWKTQGKQNGLELY